MGSGSGWDVGGVGGSCREEIEGDGLGGRGTKGEDLAPGHQGGIHSSRKGGGIRWMCRW